MIQSHQMPNLSHFLKTVDAGFLRIIATKWDLELPGGNPEAWPDVILNAITRPENLANYLGSLPIQARTAFEAIIARGGRIPWSEFIRSHGDLREMGAGRRDREHPELEPISVTEMLWYSGLLGRDFLDFGDGVKEYAYLPDEILLKLKVENQDISLPMGRPSDPESVKMHRSSGFEILDHACTVLAAIRNGIPLDDPGVRIQKVLVRFLVELLKEIGVLTSDHTLVPEAARSFLESPDSDSISLLTQKWIKSANINDLRMIPGLEFEGVWKNDPLKTRLEFLKLLDRIPTQTWWDIEAMKSSIHARFPDFQRSGGEYDSWFINSDGKYLKGFPMWFDVEGRLIQYYLEGPLFWLGLIDLASQRKNDLVGIFRKNRFFETILSGNLRRTNDKEIKIIKANSSGQILVSRGAPRAVRYQVARFCDWINDSGSTYEYQLSVGSLARASGQGLKVQQLVSLLKSHSKSPVPPSLIKFLENWEKYGIQVYLEQPTLLRVNQSKILGALQKSWAGKFLGEMINSTTVVIKPGREKQVLAALAELGWLGEIRRGV